MSEACIPEHMCCHNAVTMDHCILVFGGICRKDMCITPLNKMWLYNVYTEEWRKHEIPQGQTVPEGRLSACAMVVGSDVYMFGGCKMPYTVGDPTNELWKLETNHRESFIWSEIVVTNGEKLPSPRYGHSGWEYEEKLWTFGGCGNSSDEFLNEYGKFVHGCNNQLLCFNLSNEEWTDSQCYGMVPELRQRHATAISQDTVWLYGGGNDILFHDLHELNMRSCTWTVIQTQHMQARECLSCTLNTISDHKLVLHGGSNSRPLGSSDTWILDLPTKTWRRYTSDANTPRSSHTGSPGINNSVVIIGGLTGIDNSDRHQSMKKFIFHLLTEPKSLQQLAVQKIRKHPTVLPWKCLPRKLTVLLDIQEVEAPSEVSDLRIA